MMDPKFSFGVDLGVIKDLHAMGRKYLYIVIIYKMPGKYRCGIRTPLVDNSKRRISKFLGNGATFFQVWC